VIGGYLHLVIFNFIVLFFFFSFSLINRICSITGPPGAGKGTQCERLSKDFGFMHISAGELLRKERATGSDMAKRIDAYLSRGQIVPVEISLSLMQRAIQSAAPRTVLVDGYPRNFDNVQGWESNMPAEKFAVRGVISIDCGASELLQRVLQRGRTSGRDDDTAAQFAERMLTHAAASEPVLPHFEQKGLLFRVNGSQSVDAVYRDLKSVVRNVLRNHDTAFT
jgi:UMP-CMP kinase